MAQLLVKHVIQRELKSLNSFILTFKTSHDAMKEEDSLLSEGFFLKMIPTPRGISSECGFSIKIDTDDIKITGKLTDRENFIEKIYLMYLKKRSKMYEEIYRR